MNLTSLTLVAAALALAGCRRDAGKEAKTEAVPVRCVAPTRETVDDVLVVRGRLAPPPGGDVAVASQATGRITQLAVHEGQIVQPNDVIATIEEAQSRDALRQAEAALVQARSNESNATLTLERTKALVARGIAAKQELDDVSARVDSARAASEAARAGTDAARRTLGKVVVRTGVAGVITKVWRGVGALVDGTAASPIVQIAQGGQAELVAEVTGDELMLVREALAVSAVVLGRTVTGTVRAAGTALDPTTGLGTVRVSVTPDKGDDDASTRALPVGAFGRVTITLARREGVLTIPSAAVRGAGGDGSEVPVCSGEKGDKIDVQRVRLGVRKGDRVEVVEGLTDTSRIAIDHVLALDTGTTVQAPLVTEKTP